MTRAALTIDELERWAQFGGEWRIVALSDAEVLVDLRQCTGGLAERRTAVDPAVIAYLRGTAQPPSASNGTPGSGSASRSTT